MATRITIDRKLPIKATANPQKLSVVAGSSLIILLRCLPSLLLKGINPSYKFATSDCGRYVPPWISVSPINKEKGSSGTNSSGSSPVVPGRTKNNRVSPHLSKIWKEYSHSLSLSLSLPLSPLLPLNSQKINKGLIIVEHFDYFIASYPHPMFGLEILWISLPI